MSELTPLQADIFEVLKQHPGKDDKDIAKMVWSKNHPGEPYEGKEPSKAYVGKVRGRFKTETQAPSFEIEHVEEPVFPPLPVFTRTA